MQPALASPADPHAAYAVPQRFGIAALLGLTTLFACLFAALRAMNAPPAVYLFFGSMGTIIGLAQMKLGEAPRAASAIAGAILLPIWVLAAAFVGGSPGGELKSAVLGLPCIVVGGGVVGYFTGAILAGVFLMLDMATERSKGKRLWSPSGRRPAAIARPGDPRRAPADATTFGGMRAAVVTERELVCRICQTVSRQSLMMSQPAAPIADLDLRPAEPLRGALAFMVQGCPHCGYSASDLSFAPSHAAECVSRPEYVNLRDDASLPELARKFLCSAFIETEASERVRAAWLHLQAAWACDDAGEKTAATRCRQMAAEAIHRAVSAQRTIAGGEAADYTLLADVYRRAGDHVRALAMTGRVQEIMARSPADSAALGPIVEFEMARALAHDSQSYSIAEARADSSPSA